MAKQDQPSLLLNVSADKAAAGSCLGRRFENDDARLAAYGPLLNAKLNDPTFRRAPGFPAGDDDQVLQLSDPPFYTACPNPFVEEFIQHFGKPYIAATDQYQRDPFAADVSEGKNDPIYNAHAYHTKVPHKAIMRYILHYTSPGDVVYDAFCGTGMTGVAASLCGDKASVESLGLSVKRDGTIIDQHQHVVSRLGPRSAVLNDLAPAAAFIAYNYNTPLSPGFAEVADRLINSVEAELSWLYQTDPQNKPAGTIDSVIWSDVFLCPDCSKEIVFWEEARDEEDGGVSDTFPCPHCDTDLRKTKLDYCFETVTGPHGDSIRRIKKVPVLVLFQSGGRKLEKKPGRFELDVLAKAKSHLRSVSLPELGFDPNAEQYKRDALHLRGVKTVADFYTARNLLAMGRLWEEARKIRDVTLRNQVLWLLTSSQWLVSVMYRYRLSGGGGQQGKLAIPSIMREQNVFRTVRGKLSDIARLSAVHGRNTIVTTGSATAVTVVPDNSIDYIFTDPPFGGNLYYSDLNRIWEGWLGVATNETPEAVVHRARTVKAKNIDDYTDLMRDSFKEAHRILKPGRWITVEFHNSSNAVWNSIQEAISSAGFVVADVRTLDKKQGTFKQVTDSSSVKQDLVITAYKPSDGLERAFTRTAGKEEACWLFVESHLRKLPIAVEGSGCLEIVAERQNYLLFDRMVAFHVQRGISVPISASEFYSGLRRFPERDGMYFLPDQVTEYDHRRLAAGAVEQLELFVSDEKSAIQWVRQQLKDTPMTRQELQPLYMREAQRVWEKHEKPIELLVILQENFIKDGDERWRLPDPRRESDLEQLRQKALLKEFEQYQQTKGKLKVVRTEALRAGFKEAWQGSAYATIVEMTRRLPEDVVQEDQVLLMYYDNALMRTEG